MIYANSFKEKRNDGRFIDETMTIQDVINRGWGVAPIIEIQWKTDKGIQRISNSLGILAEVLPNRTGVVCLLSGHEKDVLKVFNSDGSERLVLPKAQTIAGKSINGQYEWFEQSSNQDGNSFSVVFRDLLSGFLYLLDIDARTGIVLSERLCQ
jgi:hypothetical protein